MLLFLFLISLLLGGGGVELIHCKVYNVGDSAGWTIIGNVNYTAWASSKTFQVRDTILFVYNKQFHNVLEVNKADYRTCNASHPIATYNSGNDSVVLRHKGHHFFICGVPTHCPMGQKVDIRIPKQTAALGTGGEPFITSAPAPAPSSLGLASPPQEGGGYAVPGRSMAVWVITALSVVVCGGFGVV